MFEREEEEERRERVMAIKQMWLSVSQQVVNWSEQIVEFGGGKSCKFSLSVKFFYKVIIKV